MNKKRLQEILKYSNPKELYIVTWNNLLKQLFTPFRVVALQDVGELKKNEVYEVEGVMVTMELKTVYLINGSYFYYYHFDILID